MTGILSWTTLNICAPTLKNTCLRTLLTAFSHKSHLDRGSRLLRIWIASYVDIPIEILKIEYKHSDGRLTPLSIANKKEDTLCDSISCLVERSRARKVAEYRYFDLKLPLALSNLGTKLNISNLRLSYRALGSQKEHSVSVARRVYYDKEKLQMANEYSNADIKKQVQKHSFLVLSKKKKLVSFKPGSWQVREDIRIPKGYQSSHPQGHGFAFCTKDRFYITFALAYPRQSLTACYI